MTKWVTNFSVGEEEIYIQPARRNLAGSNVLCISSTDIEINSKMFSDFGMNYTRIDVGTPNTVDDITSKLEMNEKVDFVLLTIWFKSYFGTSSVYVNKLKSLYPNAEILNFSVHQSSHTNSEQSGIKNIHGLQVLYCNSNSFTFEVCNYFELFASYPAYCTETITLVSSDQMTITLNFSTVTGISVKVSLKSVTASKGSIYEFSATRADNDLLADSNTISNFLRTVNPPVSSVYFISKFTSIYTATAYCLCVRAANAVNTDDTIRFRGFRIYGTATIANLSARESITDNCDMTISIY